MTEEKKKVTGLRSAVRYGKLTKMQALNKLEELASESGYKSPELLAWLKRHE